MQYVGNDIVAYKHIRCLQKWQDAHFVAKVLLPAEQQQLAIQTNKDTYLWMLWSVKEAAYKLSCFLGNREKFRAKEFEVFCNRVSITDDDINSITTFPISFTETCNQLETTVTYKQHTFFAKTLLTHQYVHSMVSNENDWTNIICYGNTHNHFNKNDFSIEVRNFTKETLEKINIIVESIEKDKDGIPSIYVNNQLQYISLSHDQQFVSFAIVN